MKWKGTRRGRWHSSALKVEDPVDFTVLPDLRDRPTDDSGLDGVLERPGEASVRRRGEGTDFRELRDYVPGDSVRHIDWKATSRRRNPVVRSYQDDGDQQVVILLDGGYRLHQKAAALYREQRIRLRRYWEKQGIITLDIRPKELSPLMINHYLALRVAGVL